MGYIGDEIERQEDPKLITGEAEYLDDLSEPGMAFMAVLRSQYGHAKLESVDTTKAEAHDSVVAVYTATDIEESDIEGRIPVGTSLPSDSNTNIRQDLSVPDRPLLAEEYVRYQGQPIAVVIAENRYAAHDILDLIDVNYQREDAITHPDEALAEDSLTIHSDVPNNVAFDWEVGDQQAVEKQFNKADHVVSVKRDHQRMIGNSIEPRGVLAKYENGKLSVAMSSQVPHMHQYLLSHVLDVPQNRIRVWTPDIGGGFGVKSKYYSSEIMAAWCSMQESRPIKWQAKRTESFLSDCQGRAHVGDAELALDEDGDILALRVDDRKDLGAYLQRAAPSVNTSSYATLLSGQYTIPKIYCRVRGAFTTQTPTDAYRGSSRPEGCYVIERLVNEAAKELEMDPAELRRRNFISSDSFPYKTPVLAEYDSGNYETALDKLLDMVDYQQLRERQAELRRDDRYLGIGLGCFVEPAGSSPVSGSDGAGMEPAHIESSSVKFHPDGSIVAYCGTADQGQGHLTTYTQILADKLGVDYESIKIYEGDTDKAASGTGSHSSRSVIMAGNSLAKSAEKVIEKGHMIAANRLNTKPEQVEFEDGTFRQIEDPDQTVEIADVAKDSYRGENLPADIEPGLDTTTYYGSEGITYPFGSHIAIVEVDPNTGEISIEKFAAVDDCGVQINPKLVEGQVVGGIVQGIGQALYEGTAYDNNGTLTNGSFQDYAMPRAPNMPDIDVDHMTTPSPLNPLGVKGTGESGTVGAPVAVLNAVLDALEPFDVDRLDMPITSMSVWNEIHSDE